MAVDAVGTGYTIDEIVKKNENEKEKKAERNTGEMGKDEFLNLLVTQLQYQDPLEPMDDKAFIAQIAQFTSLEQMQNLNKSFDSYKAFSMIGKYVKANIADENGVPEIISGKVEGVSLNGGKTVLQVDGKDVELEKVLSVSDVSITGNKGESGSISNYSQLIGLLGTFTVPAEEEGKDVKIDGIISSIENNDGEIVAKIDEIVVDAIGVDYSPYGSVEEYLEANIGKEISVRTAKDGQVATVKGILRDYNAGEGEKTTLILDGLKIPVSEIKTTSRIDLVNTEQMLLNQILYTLKQMSGGNTSETDTNTNTNTDTNNDTVSETTDSTGS